MKKNLFKILACLSVIFIAISCSSSKNATVYNTKWELDEVNGVIIDYLVDPKRDIYLTFDEGKTNLAVLQDATLLEEICWLRVINWFFQVWLPLNGLQNMRAEQLYLSLLESVDNYKLKGSRLILYQGDKEIASYRRSKEAAPPVAANWLQEC